MNKRTVGRSNRSTVAVPANVFAGRGAAADAPIAWKFTPHAAQQEILDATERYLCPAMGRRFGKSMIGGRWGTEEAIRTQGLTWWIAPTYAASMRAWSDLLANLPSEERRVYRGDRRIELKRGGLIEFHSADNPDALRGAGLAAAVLDEAAYISDYVWQDVIEPMFLTTEGRVLAISTPKTKRGWYYNLWKQGRDGAAGVRSWQMPTGANPFVSPAVLEHLRGSLPASTYAREVLAEFLDSLNNPLARIREVATATRELPVHGGSYVIGVDWGRSNDYTVFSVLRELEDGHAAMVELDRFTGLRYREQMDRLHQVCALWRPRLVLAEVNNMGDPLVEQLQLEGLPLEGFRTSAQSKEPLIRQFQLAVEQGTIAVLADENLLTECQDYEENAGEHITTFGAPDREHDDTVIATALAWRAVSGVPGGPVVDSFRGDWTGFTAPSPFATGGLYRPTETLAGPRLRRV